MKLKICKVLSSLQCRKYFPHMSLTGAMVEFRMLGQNRSVHKQYLLDPVKTKTDIWTDDVKTLYHNKNSLQEL